jgi:hypothetical protein
MRNQRAGNRNQKGIRGQIRIENQNQRTGRLRGQQESDGKERHSRTGNRNQRTGNRIRGQGSAFTGKGKEFF